jgi:deferrochelatase/peroxidase EfeB
MSDIFLTVPEPDYDGVHQPGVTDPVWPPNPPDGVGDRAAYAERYAGQLERQRHLHIVTADVACSTRAELSGLLETLAGFCDHQMRKAPPPWDARPYDPPVKSRRVTMTVGFGATLFTTLQGDDRFNLAPLRPASLKLMPQIDGDEGFKPADYATDLIILIASDDSYVNEYLFGRLYYGTVDPQILVRRVERGYARPDSREPSGFEDGLTNPRHGKPDSEMYGLVYVTGADEEPAWCVGGTYLAYRKVRRRMAGFFALSGERQQQVIGVD